MNRRDFLALSSAAAAAGYLLDPREAAAAFQPPAASAPRPAPLPWSAPFDSAPCVQNPTPTSVSITTAVNTISTAWVEYGESPDKLDRRVDGARHGLLLLNGRVHTFRLTGLKPGGAYFYRVTVRVIDFKGTYRIFPGVEARSPVYRFTTPDGGRASSARFSLINDTHENTATLAAMTGLMAATPSDVNFWNGDIFNDVRSDDHLVAQVLRPANAPYAAQTPMCFVCGNHDVRGIHARNLDRFAPPPGDGERRYYAFTHGPVSFVVLDTGEDKPDDHKAYAGLGVFSRYRREQAQWLKGAMSDPLWRSAKYRVAVLHIPLWGDGGSDDSRNQWHTLLNDGKTDVTISGHIHTHSFTPPADGRRYAQLVGGGPALETATFIHAQADAKALTISVKDHAGKEIASHGFKPS